MTTDNTINTDADIGNFTTLQGMHERNPEIFPMQRLRYISRNREHNGLAASGALFLRNRTLIVDIRKFMHWFLEDQEAA